MKQNSPYVRTLFISSIIFILFFMYSTQDSSYALTDAEYSQFISESQEYREADRRLNRVWKQLMGSLDESGKAELKKSQRNWIKNERDSGAKLISAQKGISLASAYALVTEQRVRALEQLLEPTKEVKSEERAVREDKRPQPAKTSAPKELSKKSEEGAVQKKKTSEPVETSAPKEPISPKDKSKALIFTVLGVILMFVAWICWQKRKRSEGAEFREKVMRDVGKGSIGKQVKAHISAGIYGLMALLIGLVGFVLFGMGLGAYG